METIEIVIYTGIALIVGVLILGFVLDIEPNELVDSFSTLISGESDNQIQYKKVEPPALISTIYNLWEECGKGEIELEQTVYVIADDTTSKISKSFIFEKLKQINYCTQLQSEEYDCGSKEDLKLSKTISLPAVIKITCDSNGIELIN